MNRLQKAAVASLAYVLAGASSCRSEAPAASEATLRAYFPTHAAEILDGSPSRFVPTVGGFLGRATPTGSGPETPLTIELPGKGGNPVVFEGGGLRAKVTEAGLRGGGARAGAAVAYENDRGRSYWTEGPGGFEEWLLLAGGTRSEIRWTVQGAQLKATPSAVLLLDARGMPRVAVTAPRAFGSDGEPLLVRLTADGQDVVLSVPATPGSVLVDPLWSTVADALFDARYSHTATLLPGDRVLVAAGAQVGTELASAEVFTADAGTWAQASPLAQARQGHAAAALPQGEVLVTGGYSGATGALATTEVFGLDGGWTSAGSLAAPRYQHTATPLSTGLVLVTGGRDDAGVLASAELFDPDSGVWTATGPLGTARRQHSAALLADGKVLVTGGLGAAGTELTTAEIYDPSGGVFAPAAPMASSRADHSETLLASGRVLVVGGTGTGGATAERYDPLSDSWTAAGTLPFARVGHAATRLADGRVLMSGGSTTLAASAVYDPASNSFAPAGCPATARVHHTATALPASSSVLVAGGFRGAALGTSELFDPSGGKALGVACSSACECASGFCADGVCCNSECNAGSCDACSTAAGAPASGTCFFFPSSVACRPAADGGCDVAETCTGASGECPIDAFAAPGVSCRSDAGVCDVAETCTGASPACPADAKLSSATVCRASTGACDVQETCDGVTDSCPADAVQASTVVCHASIGACDVAESCDGTTSTCPPDVVLSAGNAGSPACGAYVCDGLQASCPGGCATDAQCATGNFCGDGVCSAKKAAGGACERDAECATGPCADRFCCNSACTGTCESCDQAGHEGTCTPVPARAAGRSSCASFVCDGTSAACPTSCATSAQCASSLICIEGACVVPPIPDAGVDAGVADAGPTDAGEGADAGPGNKRYVGWSCASGGPGLAPIAMILLAGLALARRRGRAALAASSALALALSPELARADAPAPLHVSATALRDVTASAVGAEVGASYSLSSLADLGAAASLGQTVGGRLTLALHPREEGWVIRPYLQLRGLYHPVAGGAGVGGGAQVGAQYALGPGRIGVGVLGELYSGPPGYTPFGLFALAGYELDLFKPTRSSALVEVEPTRPVEPAEPAATEPPRPEVAHVEVVPPPKPTPVVVAPPPKPPLADLDDLPDLPAGPAPAPVKPPEPAPAPQAGGETRVVARIHIRDTITFGPRDTKVKPKFASVLKKVSGILKATPTIKTLRIGGHADDNPTPQADAKLSTKRAEAVIAALLKLGVARSRLQAVGFGRSRPLAPKNAPPKAREVNRRVDFLIIDPAEMEPDSFREP